MANVKLNKIEQGIVDRLPEASRKEATEKLLAEKTAKMERANKNRTEFRCIPQASGVLSVYGLGRQFPTSLYPSEWDRLIQHLDVIKAELAKMPKS